MNWSTFIILAGLVELCVADDYENLLYNHLINGYSNLIKPAKNSNDVVRISIDLKLSRLIDIDEKNQIMTTDLWITQIWHDYRLTWNPHQFNNISKFYIPAVEIWIPDMIVHNTANGKYDLSGLTKAELHSNGKVKLRAPAILKSFCKIDVEYFPFDIQSCFIKFSSWTYDYKNLFLTHIRAKGKEKLIKRGIEFDPKLDNDEWDIVDTLAQLTIEPPEDDRLKENFYPDIKFCLIMRRKTLFYMYCLIAPCAAMSFLTILVFLLSSKSDEKITLSISILLALTLFFLLLLDIMPPTSLVVPLFGQYLVFTITMLSLSIFFSIYILNIHHRRPELHSNMPEFIRTIFLKWLPKLLFLKDLMQLHEEYTDTKYKQKCRLLLKSGSQSLNTLERVYKKNNNNNNVITHRMLSIKNSYRKGERLKDYLGPKVLLVVDDANSNPFGKTESIQMRRPNKTKRSQQYRALNNLILENIHYLRNITGHIKKEYQIKNIREEWQMLAYILDRVLLYMFSAAFIIGFMLIFIGAPTNFTSKEEIDVEKACFYH